MTVSNSMSIHQVVKVDIEDLLIPSSDGDFNVKKYRFIDNSGNKFTVTAFLAENRTLSCKPSGAVNIE